MKNFDGRGLEIPRPENRPKAPSHQTPPTPIFRGELAGVEKRLAELSSRYKPGIPEIAIEQMALTIAFESVKDLPFTERNQAWMETAEMLARYLRRRMGLPEGYPACSEGPEMKP